MMSALTDDLHLEQTRFFVEQNPVDIIVTRTSQVSDGKGGHRKGTPTTLPVQTVRKVGSARITADKTFTTRDGRIVVPSATLIGLPELDLLDGDQFETEEGKWEIVGVDRDPPWRVQCAVVEQV
jgi:hypothetical protein